MSAPAATRLLVFGATGKTGIRVVERAVARGWAVSTFVRSPARLPEALRSKVHVIVGDVNDAAAVSAAVASETPSIMLDATSALPFGHAKGAPANTADRSILLRAAVGELAAKGRLGSCYFVMVGGQLVPEPGGTINTTFAWAIEWALRVVVARRAWATVGEAIAWLFAQPPEFRFTMLRMGQLSDVPSRGPLAVESTAGGNYPRTDVSYEDVADAIMALAEAGNGPRACYLNYPVAVAPA